MKFLSVVELKFVKNRFFEFLSEGWQRWRARYLSCISREGIEIPWTFIKTRKMLNISSIKGRLLEFACLVFYPSPAPGLPLYPFLGPDQSEKREFCTTCMRMLGTTPFPSPKTAAGTKHSSQVIVLPIQEVS